jgi:membrane protein DedA with SNARE-associated domain
MIHQIIRALSAFITFFVYKLGYGGVLFLMALESCNIPIPSEVILPYAGFLVSQNQMNIHLASFFGALGCLIGSMLSYWLGLKLGRPFLMRYGKWFLISHRDIERSDNFISKYGDATYFFSRLLPVVRTFISFVAGISHGKFGKFCLYTFLGSYILVYIGVKLGDNWNELGPWWNKFQDVIVIVIILGIAWHIARALRNGKNKKEIG